jgi:hypothetical protein
MWTSSTSPVQQPGASLAGLLVQQLEPANPHDQAILELMAEPGG